MRLEALKIRFLDRCSRDLAVLEQLLRAPEEVSPTDLRTMVHQMSGAAGALGFPQLTASAMHLDNQLATGTPPSRENVQALIDQLKSL